MKRILLVDDDDLIRYSLAKLLGKAGYEVYEESDGSSVLSVLETVAIDLLVTDIIMPEKEGISVILDVREEFPDLPILAISGGGRMQADYLKTAKALGANTTLHKPFSNDSFLSCVRELVGG